MRAKNIKVAYCQSAAGRDYTTQKRWDRELHEYREARRQGVQPDGTTLNKVRLAMELSDRTGTAYDGGNPSSLISSEK